MTDRPHSADECPSCGAPNPDGNRFCGSCGSRLADTEPVTRGDERKVVTILFCDLVGFTASSEGADPEDVRSLLKPYHGLLRREIERLGGTVEKFVGDAVMAVFGAPIAHEDDPQRAIRAGLSIMRSLGTAGDGLRVRIGINTGEVLVAMDARPEAGEGYVTGDAVNTASRLQGVAPEMGIDRRGGHVRGRARRLRA